MHDLNLMNIKECFDTLCPAHMDMPIRACLHCLQIKHGCYR